MAVQLRAVASANDQETGTGPTVNRPVGTQTGDLLIATMLQDRDPSVAMPGNMSMPAGWTLFGYDGISTIAFMSLWYKVAAADDPVSWKITDHSTAGDACDCSAAILAFSGWDTNQTLAVTFAQNATAGTIFTAPSVAGVSDGMLICAFGRGDGNDNTASFSTYSGSLAEQVDEALVASYVTLGIGTEPLSASGATGTRTAVCSDSSRSMCWSLAIAPSPPPIPVAWFAGIST